MAGERKCLRLAMLPNPKSAPGFARFDARTQRGREPASELKMNRYFKSTSGRGTRLRLRGRDFGFVILRHLDRPSSPGAFVMGMATGITPGLAPVWALPCCPGGQR